MIKEIESLFSKQSENQMKIWGEGGGEGGALDQFMMGSKYYVTL